MPTFLAAANEQLTSARSRCSSTPAARASGSRSLDRLVSNWFTRAGVRKPPGEAAHAFRHTYPVGLVNNGAGLPAVQELLGHENLSTTSIYLRASAAHLHETVSALPVRKLLLG